MASVACPKCAVVTYETTSGGWRFEPSSGCIDLRSTDWGTKGEFALAMPDEVFWPGRSHRDHVKQVSEQAQARETIVVNRPKKDSET
jgi:hypothetical protein